MANLKPAIPFLQLSALREFKSQQDKRADTVRAALKRGQGDIDRIKEDAVQYSHSTTRLIGSVPVTINDPRDRGVTEQVVAQQHVVRINIDKELKPVMEKMLAAKVTAKEYLVRHWSKPQVLARAGGNAELPRKANLFIALKHSGRTALFDWGQLAIDTADAVLGDVVYRIVSDLPNDERPFHPAQILSLINNAEYTEATGLLKNTADAYDAANMAVIKFRAGRHAQVTHEQILSGLQKRADETGADDFDIDSIITPEGAIREDALVQLAKRTK